MSEVQKRIAENKYFVADEVSTATTEKRIIHVSLAENKTHSIPESREIILAMVDIQQHVLDTANGANICLIVDFVHLLVVIGPAARMPEFRNLLDLMPSFTKIVVYSSQADVFAQSGARLIDIIARRAVKTVRTAKNLDSALKIANE
jgi:hypothetical protein